ncbi:MAG: head GIN domain-containing protein [Leeuwenhoekiella sp.]
MKKLFILLAITCLSIPANAQWGSKKIKGNGSMTLIDRDVKTYDAVHVAGFYDVQLIAGEEGSLKIEGESNLLEYIITEVKGNILEIKTEKGINLQPSYNKMITITVPFKDLYEVNLSGSGDVVSRDRISATTFKTALAGSGDIVLEVEAKSVEARVSGSGDLTLKGRTEEVDFKLSGSGDIHAGDLMATDAEASIAGSGDIELNCDGGLLKARVAGSGDIKYNGKPAREDSKVAGSGSISN